MTSGDDGWEVLSDILRTIAYDYHWPDLGPAERTLAAIPPERLPIRTYRFPDGDLVTFWRDDHQLQTRSISPRSSMRVGYSDPTP